MAHMRMPASPNFVAFSSALWDLPSVMNFKNRETQKCSQFGGSILKPQAEALYEFRLDRLFDTLRRTQEVAWPRSKLMWITSPHSDRRHDGNDQAFELYENISSRIRKRLPKGAVEVLNYQAIYKKMKSKNLDQLHPAVNIAAAAAGRIWHRVWQEWHPSKQP